MRRFRRQRRIVAIAFAAVLACGSSAFALDPTLEISQYAHTSWKIRDGFIDSQIRVIAQTPDGFLWLGTDLGLFRFDGVRTVAIRLPDDQPLPSKTVMALLGASDGTARCGSAPTRVW